MYQIDFLGVGNLRHHLLNYILFTGSGALVYSVLNYNFGIAPTLIHIHLLITCVAYILIVSAVQLVFSN